MANILPTTAASRNDNSFQIGYCTNVHAGPDLETTWENLRQHALEVKRQFRPDRPMGVGLWLAAEAAHSLRDSEQLETFADWLGEVGLVPFTLNGFPYGDFHQPVVKHRVYEPTWFAAARRDYTQTLATILDRLLPAGVEGSISTLPVAWGEPRPTADQLATAAAYLRETAEHLAKLESETGRLIHVCIEPEPGCFIQRSEDIVRFFEDHLLPGGDESTIRRHVRVCHDVCHAVVMFEEQSDVLARYRAAGIQVGKVQVSSAVLLQLDAIQPDRRTAALAQLRAFAEDRYLHQTMIRSGKDSPPRFWEDLPAALDAIDDPAALTGEWRIHFHVPVYLESFGLLGASRAQIIQCVQAVLQDPGVTHFEVETYAWGVLPRELQQQRLADGIAQEMQWFAQQLGSA
jgi:hypothetical protein